ncbi:DUF1801 domain-containing protein [Paraglaciecola aquimarina]|uniref:DUF1801 domain-containing protein n=1 Tax=Paraglaciecola aquimarina TaxID=1235557 RepID=A0ABU3SXB6_9ALTE|nr:DUF1801 domain-containing protein [Paraglaciecola aquimarina]MDU0354617.1 DUF1801 domain-containing protein [Paraglaciecola aquimarina]
MQYDVKDPIDYLNTIQADWRKAKLLAVRALIFSQMPQIVEDIHYKMLSYSLSNKVVFHLNAQKHHVALYAGDIQKIDPNGIMLTGLNTGKGCIRLNKSIEIEQTLLFRFIKKAADLSLEGVDLGC